LKEEKVITFNSSLGNILEAFSTFLSRVNRAKPGKRGCGCLRVEQQIEIIKDVVMRLATQSDS
jgi:hypothetical protein